MKNNLYTIILFSILGAACGETLDEPEQELQEELGGDMIPLNADIRNGSQNGLDLFTGSFLERQWDICENNTDLYGLNRVLTRWECNCFPIFGDDLGPEEIIRLGEEGACINGSWLQYCDVNGFAEYANCESMNLTCGMNDDLGVHDCLDPEGLEHQG